MAAMSPLLTLITSIGFLYKSPESPSNNNIVSSEFLQIRASALFFDARFNSFIL